MFDLDAARQARGLGPYPDPDPVQVKAKLRAYLAQRGRRIAQDLDLDRVTPEELAELGRASTSSPNIPTWTRTWPRSWP
jgi:hypothetical protein